ncbi:MAG: hypothetical protein K6C35_11290 [Eubacterium sp.]|nr:hypothetical protein [Eubacterium sp.]SEG06716.1 hypothetical protein SAMN04487934_10789 [Eubacterium ruminantium]
MKRRILQYLRYIDGILEDNAKDEEYWENVIRKHKDQIAFFSHERLIHLIVFALVSVCTVISIMTFIVSGHVELIPLIVLFFVLLIPYCAHYYLLENSVQKMYEQYDEMINKTEKYFRVDKSLKK